MLKGTSNLYKTLLFKERIQSVLCSLEQQKANSAIKTHEYLKKKVAYQKQMTCLISEIAAVKRKLRKRRQQAQDKLQILQSHIDQLNIKFTAGKMAQTKYQKSLAAILEKSSGIRDEIQAINMLLAAKSSKEIRLSPEESAKIMSLHVPGIAENSVLKRLVSPRIKIFGLIGGASLVVSVFLPWLSLQPGITVTDVFVSGIKLSPVLGGAGLIGGLLCIVALLHIPPWFRGAVITFVGLAASMALLMAWPLYIGSGPADQQNDYEIVRQLLKTSILREGFYLFIAGLILCFTGGIADLVKRTG